MSTLEMVLWASLGLAILALVVGASCCMIRPPRMVEDDAMPGEADRAPVVDCVGQA